MTDGWLMEADCVHGVTWYECDECCQQDSEDEADVTPRGEV